MKPKDNKVDGLKNSLLRNVSTIDTHDSNNNSTNYQNKKTTKTVSLFFKIDEDHAKFYNAICSAFNLKKTSEAFEFILDKVKPLVAQEMKDIFEERAKESYDFLNK